MKLINAIWNKRKLVPVEWGVTFFLSLFILFTIMILTTWIKSDFILNLITELFGVMISIWIAVFIYERIKKNEWANYHGLLTELIQDFYNKLFECYAHDFLQYRSLNEEKKDENIISPILSNTNKIEIDVLTIKNRKNIKATIGDKEFNILNSRITELKESIMRIDSFNYDYYPPEASRIIKEISIKMHYMEDQIGKFLSHKTEDGFIEDKYNSLCVDFRNIIRLAESLRKEIKIELSLLYNRRLKQFEKSYYESKKRIKKQITNWNNEYKKIQRRELHNLKKLSHEIETENEMIKNKSDKK